MARTRIGTAVWYAVLAVLWGATGLLFLRAVPLVMSQWRTWEGFVASQPRAVTVLEDPLNQYDPTLGWKHIPNKDATILEGFRVHINSRGFRADEEYSDQIPAERYRIVGVGDSFTFGNVPQEETWPALLEKKDPRLQVINMGASAYGVDQMYLWYRQDGVRLKADLVIVAAIMADFERVYLYKWMSGHGRPRLTYSQGALTVTNVPVPPRVEPGKLNIHPMDLRAFRDPRSAGFVPGDDELPYRIVEAFQMLVQSQGARFLLVLLPEWKDFDDDRRGPVRDFCQKHRIPFLDLTGQFQQSTAGKPRISVFRGPADLHYNSYGNEIVAEGVFTYLRTLGYR